MVSEEIIEEAAKRGIVPGARIKCAYNNMDEAIVPEASEWIHDAGTGIRFNTTSVGVFIQNYKWKWAEVIEAPKPQTLEPKYSGPNSTAFWDTVNALPECAQGELYSLGVALQNLEGQVLKALRENTKPPKKETLEPGMATKCGPAMRAAIMERAKELGLMDPSSKEKDTTEGIWVLDFGLQKGMLHTCTYSNSEGLKFIPNHEFLRRLENTKPPKKELTTEEKLAEAVRLLDRVTTGHENLMKACGHYTTPEDFTHTRAARAFLKSIEP